ncbi:DNase I-like protein, partial [Suillus weaverae]
MRGRWHQGIDKWSHLNQIVREQKIGIIALQETHLSKTEEDSLNQLPGTRLHIILSIDPDQMNAKGVALVLNKNIIDITKIKMTELIPGRALLCTIGWHNEHNLTILTIYAPNDPSDNQPFWEEISQALKDKSNPDVMLGDFNLVEDPLDCLPPKHDAFSTTNALTDLKLNIGLRDGWRHENPNKLEYLFSQSTQQGGRQSQIDQIYVSESFIPFSKEWEISPSGIPTDHKMVSTKLSDKRMPFVGKGRWVLPLHILKDKKLGEDILKLGKELQADISKSKSNRSEDYNPQTVFKSFKMKAIKLCRDTAKKSVPSQINKLNTQLKTSLNDSSIPEEEQHLIGSYLQE